MVTLSGASAIVLRTHSRQFCFGFAHHARNQIDIDLRKADGAGELVGPVDLLCAVSATVRSEDIFVEVFDSQAEAGYAHPLEDLEFALGDGARFALECDLFGLVPGKLALHRIHDAAELPVERNDGVPPPK